MGIIATIIPDMQPLSSCYTRIVLQEQQGNKKIIIICRGIGIYLYFPDTLVNKYKPVFGKY